MSDRFDDAYEVATPCEREAIDAIRETGSMRAAAKKLGRNSSSISRAVKRAEGRVTRPELVEEASGSAPEAVSRTVTLYKTEAESGAVYQWVRRDHRLQLVLDAIDTATQALSELKPRPPIPRPEVTPPAELMNLYGITDYHMGMLAHAPETLSDPWDIRIAEKTLRAWFDLAVARSPEAHTGVLLQLGDFAHWSGMAPVTPKHGHMLDADTRFQRLVEVCLRALDYGISRMLEKHETVKVTNVAGNHDEAVAPWLRSAFAMVYRNEPRVEIDTTSSLYHILTHGRVGIMAHHGHGAKPKQLPGIFASNFPREFGNSDHRYAFCGHRHSREQYDSDTNGVIVRQLPTLAPNDAYSASFGYRSARRAEVSTFHREHGEVAITVITPEMLKI